MCLYLLFEMEKDLNPKGQTRKAKQSGGLLCSVCAKSGAEMRSIWVDEHIACLRQAASPSAPAKTKTTQ